MKKAVGFDKVERKRFTQREEKIIKNRWNRERVKLTLLALTSFK